MHLKKKNYILILQFFFLAKTLNADVKFKAYTNQSDFYEMIKNAQELKYNSDTNEIVKKLGNSFTLEEGGINGVGCKEFSYRLMMESKSDPLITGVVSLKLHPITGKLQVIETYIGCQGKFNPNSRKNDGAWNIEYARGRGEDELNELLNGIRKLEVSVESADEIESKIGIPIDKKKTTDGQKWIYFDPLDSVASSRGKLSIYISINNYGKLDSIVAYKGSDVIYTKSNLPNIVSENKSISSRGDATQKPSSSLSGGDYGVPFPVMDSFPSAPKPGQAFLNTSDSHFYAWNGKEWIQLDQPKPTP